MSDTITFTLFSDHHAGRMEQRTLAWRDMPAFLESIPRQVVKAASPMIKLATFDGRRTAKGSHRADEFMVAVTGLEGDYDGEIVSPDEANEALERLQIRGIIYTSFSHTREGPRWRVVVPFSGQYTPADRYRLMCALNGALGGILNGESFTLSQAYYLGGPQVGEYLVRVTFDDPEDGRCIDELEEAELEVLIARGMPKGRAGVVATGHAGAGLPPSGLATEAITADWWGSGDRHGNIVRVAARLTAKGHPYEEVVALTEGLVLRNCDPPFPRERWGEITAAVDSAFDKFAPAPEAIPDELRPDDAWWNAVAGEVDGEVGPAFERDLAALRRAGVVTATGRDVLAALAETWPRGADGLPGVDLWTAADRDVLGATLLESWIPAELEGAGLWHRGALAVPGDRPLRLAIGYGDNGEPEGLLGFELDHAPDRMVA